MPSVCFTGHRKLADQYYNRYNPSVEWQTLATFLDEVVRSLIYNYHVDLFITGLAIGVDMLAGECVQRVRISLTEPNAVPTPGPPTQIKLVGAMPFPSQAGKWPQPTRDHFTSVYNMCDEVVAVSQDPYSPAKMQIRNEWMVDRATYVIAIWNGIESGGTWNCIRYAYKCSKPVLWISPTNAGWTASWMNTGDPS